MSSLHSFCIALRDNVGGGAAPAASAAPSHAAAAPQPAFQAPSMNDDMELLEDSDDLPF